MASASSTRVHGVSIVKGEIHNVLSLMRLNARFSETERFTHEIGSFVGPVLVRSLMDLHDVLSDAEELEDIPTVQLLRPFLDVVEASETSGPITGQALGSISKFIMYGFISPDANQAALAVNCISAATARCRFEATDNNGDEVVLLRVLGVLLDVLRCLAGRLLTDDSVCDAFVCCYAIARAPHASVLLRKAAEQTLAQLVLTVFARLEDVEEPAEGFDPASLPPLPATPPVLPAGVDVAASAPHGFASLFRLLRHMCRMTSKDGIGALGGYEDNQQGSIDRRLLGLTLINVMLETCGPRLGVHAHLVDLLANDLCRNLLANSRSNDVTVLGLTLRAVYNMFVNVRTHMKVQLEVFFNSIHLGMAGSASSGALSKEMTLQSCVDFCREPSLVLDLYINYDCDVQCTNLFENMCKFLCKATFPGPAGRLNTLNVLSLEGVLAVLRSIARLTEGAKNSEGGSPANRGAETPGPGDDVEGFRARRAEKKRLLLAAEQFNKDPRQGLEYLKSVGLLPSNDDADAVAEWLSTGLALNKDAVGEYLGNPAEFNLQVLKAYAEKCPMGGSGFVSDLRSFLSGFRLPGEAQKIARIMETFATRLFEVEPGIFADSDAVYVLAYSVIMLNTDLHNPQVKKKMSLEEFVRNSRGINGGADFELEYLQSIYKNIKAEQIKMTAEMAAGEGHDQGGSSGAAGMPPAGGPRGSVEDLLQARGKSMTLKTLSGTPSVMGCCRDMFLTVWEPSLAALVCVLEAGADARANSKAIQAVEYYASACDACDLAEPFNRLLSALARCTSVSNPSEAAAAGAGGGVVRPGKARLCGTALVKVAFQHKRLIKKSWGDLIAYMMRLNALHLLPSSLTEFDDFVDLRGQPLPDLIPSDAPDSTPESGGVMKSVVGWLWGGSSASDEKRGREESSNKDDDNEDSGPTPASFAASLPIAALFGNTRRWVICCARRCQLNDGVNGCCYVWDVLTAVSSLPVPCVQALMSALIASSGAENGVAAEASLSIEWAVNVVLNNGERCPELWSLLRVHLESHVRRAAEGHGSHRMTLRVCVAMLRLCIRLLGSVGASEASDSLQGLTTLAALPVVASIIVAERVLMGLLTLLRTSARVISAVDGWPAVFTLLEHFSCTSLPESVKASVTPRSEEVHGYVMELLGLVAEDAGVGHVSISNYALLLSALRRCAAMPGRTAMSLSLAYSVFTALRLAPCKELRGSEDAVDGTVPHLQSESPAKSNEDEAELDAKSASDPGCRTPDSHVSHGYSSPSPLPEKTSERMGSDSFWNGMTPDYTRWLHCWLASLAFFGEHAAGDASRMQYMRNARSRALQLLEQALLSGEVRVEEASAWVSALQDVLFPLLEWALQRKGYGNASPTSDDSPLRLLLLVLKIFTHRLNFLSTSTEFAHLTQRLLALVLANRTQVTDAEGANAGEAVTDAMRGVLMVMVRDGAFDDAKNAGFGDRWEQLRPAISTLCPELDAELFPKETTNCSTPAAGDGQPTGVSTTIDDQGSNAIDHTPKQVVESSDANDVTVV